MNSLSWFVYAIQFAEALSSFCILMAWLTILVFVVRHVTVMFEASAIKLVLDPNRSFHEDVLERDRLKMEYWREKRPSLKHYAGVFLVLVATSHFVPSRQTLLLIAGSEVGQRVATSSTMQSVVDPGLDLLKTWISAEKQRLLKGTVEVEKETK